MDGDRAEAIRITLTPLQVEQVLRAALVAPPAGIASLIVDSLATGSAGAELDPRLSRSLLRGLSLLTCFDRRRRERGIVEIAGELDMSPSTTHRYAQTLVHLGLLERSPGSRKYRLPAR